MKGAKTTCCVLYLFVFIFILIFQARQTLDVQEIIFLLNMKPTASSLRSLTHLEIRKESM